jgi:hypothetical protein
MQGSVGAFILRYNRIKLIRAYFYHRQTRSTFDTAEVKRSFGPVTIEYGKVQSKVSLKYDSWHKDALAKFSALLSSHMTTFHAEVAKVSAE